MVKKAKKNLPKVSDSEWEILGAIWDHGPLAARDVFQHVSENQDWASKTVKTMLARLVKKGALDYDQIGNSYLYRTVYTREELAHEATSSFIKRFQWIKYLKLEKSASFNANHSVTVL